MAWEARLGLKQTSAACCAAVCPAKWPGKPVWGSEVFWQ